MMSRGVRQLDEDYRPGYEFVVAVTRTGSMAPGGYGLRMLGSGQTVVNYGLEDGSCRDVLTRYP